MLDTDCFGKIWMASSPLTGNFSTIKQAIDIGVDSIVLKTTTTIPLNENRNGIRIIKKGGMIDIKGKYFLHSGSYRGRGHLDDTLSCRSTYLDIEMLTVEETKLLYSQINTYSPETKVIISFAPMKNTDFEVLNNLPGDGVEINTRWFPLDLERPYIVNVFLSENYDAKDLTNESSIYWEEELKTKKPEEIINGCIIKSKKYAEEKKRKIAFFKQGMSKLRTDRLILIKLARQYWEMNQQKYIELDNHGFTFSDSEKGGVTTSISGVQIDVFGKGSNCGGTLREMTLVMSNLLKKQNPNKYLSASGGLMEPDQVLQAFNEGADSVQICSAVYFGGFKKLEEIVTAVKNNYP